MNLNPENYASHIVLDGEQLATNVEFIRSLARPSTQLSAVIKGNAYGHGIAEFVPLAIAAGIAHFSVYGLEEALAFDESDHGEAELMIMGYINPENLDWVISRGYSFFIYDLIQLKNAATVAKRIGTRAHIHLEVETGMNRTGLDAEDFPEAIDFLLKNENHFQFTGICTHLAGAESFTNFDRIRSQIKKFKDHVDYFTTCGIDFQIRHAACSAGLVRFPEAHFDLVRVGIMLYGYWPNRETMVDYLSRSQASTDPIKGVLTWKSKIMTTKVVARGQYIGYGTAYLANTSTKVAIVPVGYAYGYSRGLSNQGRVLIAGERVPVIGIVNMNMMAVDVTAIADAKAGDEVVLIGDQGAQRISVASFGEMSSQLNYELLTRLPHHIPRIKNESWHISN